MAAINLFSRSEWQSLLFRSAGVLASAASGLISLKVFLTYGHRDAAGLLAVVGWLVFVPLCQLGFGRPAYGAVRARHATGTLSHLLVSSFLRLFAEQSVVATVVFSILGIVVASRQGFAGSLSEVAVFALGLAALSASSFQRDLAYSISAESNYEFWEFVRRCTLLTGYGMVVAGAPLWLVGIGGLFVAGWSQWRVSRLLIGSGEFGTTLQPSDWRDLDPKLGIAAKRYLLFSANEVLLYNLPLVVFTATSANNEIIYFGIWLRLYQLLVLPMRMIVDARINRQVTAYFQRRPDKVRKELNVSLLAASGFMTLSLATVFVCKRSILGWIGAAPMASDCWLIASLGIWGVGNTIQHVFGSFTLSYGGGFGFALRTSIVTLVTMCLVFAVELTLLAKIGPILFSLGVVYAVLSLFYGKHVGRILRKIPHTDS